MKVLKYGSTPRSGTHWFGHLLWWAFYKRLAKSGQRMKVSHGHHFKGHSRLDYCEWFYLFGGHFERNVDIYLLRKPEDSEKSARRLGMGWIAERIAERHAKGSSLAKMLVHYEDLKDDPNLVMLKIAKTFGLGSPDYISPEIAAMRVGFDSYDPAPFYQGSLNPGWLRDYHLEKLNVLRWLDGVRDVAEVGVGQGHDARLVREAWPDATYIGYDGAPTGWGEVTVHQIDGQLVIQNTQQLKTFGRKYDLVIVGGDRTVKGVQHDIGLAVEAGAKWILVDAAEDPAVISGAAEMELGLLRIPLAGTPKEVALIRR